MDLSGINVSTYFGAWSSPFLGIFVATLILEDAALLASLALLYSGQLDVTDAFFANALGICFGDSLLYGVGNAARRLGGRWPRLEALAKRLASIPAPGAGMILARLIPGARLPVYVGAGLARYPYRRFLPITLACTIVWVSLVLWLGMGLFNLLAAHRLASLAIVAGAFLLLHQLGGALAGPWQRRALRYSWRRWRYFEFWPGWLFYPPVVAYYVWLAVKYRGIRHPLYSNPRIRNGGLIGESKWEFLRYVSADQHYALPTFYVETSAQVAQLLSTAQVSFPFILKPDKGQRGYGVRLIRSEAELNSYFQAAESQLIVQEYCDWPHEAGIFYYRFPTAAHGSIFSITDKEFPFVTGDGVTKLGHLILADPRARLIASTYVNRFRGEMDRVLLLGEHFRLATCGNHCQGAIFLNGASLDTPALREAIGQIARTIPDFYAGRFDIRYASKAALMRGESFKIVEINGAGAEATHIWDRRTTLAEAYRCLFTQWDLLFRIGIEVQKQQLQRQPVLAREFIGDVAALYLRNRRLAVSS